MHDPDTGEVLVACGGVIAPETQAELFMQLRWALARVGLIDLEDGWHCRFEGECLTARFFPRKPKRKTGRPTRPAPVSGAVAQDLDLWPGLAIERGEIDLISPCTSDT